MLNAKRLLAGLTLLSFLLIVSPAFGQKGVTTKRQKNASGTKVESVPQKDATQLDFTTISGGLGPATTLSAPTAETSTSTKTTTSSKSLSAPSGPKVIQ